MGQDSLSLLQELDTLNDGQAQKAIHGGSTHISTG